VKVRCQLPLLEWSDDKHCSVSYSLVTSVNSSGYNKPEVKQHLAAAVSKKRKEEKGHQKKEWKGTQKGKTDVRA